MLDPHQLRVYVVRPALQYIEKWSRDAEELVMGTAAQESNLVYLRQLGNGPAAGLWQMEPETHDDIWKNYLEYRRDLRMKITHLRPPGVMSTTMALAGSLSYAAAMCRVHYLRVPKALPSGDDVEAMARYWKRFYNTAEGKGTEEEFVRNYRRIVATSG